MIVIGGIFYGMIQLPLSKNYIVDTVENSFNVDRHAVLKIGKLTGHIPFSFSVSDIAIYTDSTHSEPILYIDSAKASIDLTGWLTNQLIIPSLHIVQPKISLNAEQDYAAVFSKKTIKSDSLSESENHTENTVGSFLLPFISIQRGEVELRNVDLKDSLFINTETITLSDFSMESFLEYGPSQRFIDIEQLSFGIPEANINRIHAFGQVFNDDRYLEFNAFSISTKNNALRFSAEFAGINVLANDLIEQFEESTFNITVDEVITYPENLRKVVVGFPEIDEQIYARIKAQGSADSITFSDFYLLVGNSELEAYGEFRPPNQDNPEFFEFNIERLDLDTLNIQSWLPKLSDSQHNFVSDADIDGSIYGSFLNTKGDIELISEKGFISLNGSIDRRDSLLITAAGIMNNLNIGELVNSSIEFTNLNGMIQFETNTLQPNSAVGNLNVELSEGTLNAFDFDSLNIKTNWLEGDIIPSYNLISDEAYLNGQGFISISDSLKVLELNGSANQLDLKALTNITQLSNAIVDLNYDLSISGSGIENTFGLITVDVPYTIVDGDTLKAHQIYADFNSNSETGNSFRLTSTPLDLSLTGNFDPFSVTELAAFWVRNIKNKIDSEVLFQDDRQISTSFVDSLNTNIELDFDLKDLHLIRAYLPTIPEIESQISGNSNFNLSSESILFNATFFDSSIVYDSFQVDSLNFQVTGSFRKDEPIKSFSSLQVLSSASNFNSNLVEAGLTELSFQLDDDSVYIQHSIHSIAGENDFFIDGIVHIADSMLHMIVDSLSLGNDIYQWQSIGKPSLAYFSDERLEFLSFEFQNEQESLNFEGTFSDQATDSVNYIIRNVDLARISDLLNGRINFSGVLDADFTTKSLTRIPTIQGGLGIDAFSIDQRVVGDVDVTSLFNSDLNRFDTKVTVSTDSAKYPDYFTRTERRGQNIAFDGYVLAPKDGEFEQSDSLFYFDLDFESIDLWILPFIAPRVFTEMSGIASGGGTIWGNLEDFDFSVNYDIGTDDAIFFRPRFLDTYYFGLGNITLNREDGLVFNDLFIIDPSGGSANLNGTYDLGSFGRIHEMDLTLEMDEFHFLNNSFDPDIAFFGDAYGSSTIRITGTNLNPILTTETPVVISDFSRIGIPLLEETEFDEDNKFIRFVDSFEFETSTAEGPNLVNSVLVAEEEIDPFERTFVERFTLDLQFVAQNPMEVQLIFDPVTGDQIEADGIGRLGIRLEDEQLSMFGQFDINGGTYQFVSGEIFARRFDLEPGGTIIWEGEPGNARLDLNAIYSARPDINTLSQARSTIDSETSQRVPVELVLNVGGSISAIENNFFFRLPNNFETRQNSTLATQIAALNRNEDEKLLQAASFLLMGDFIPSSSRTADSDASQNFTDNFSGSSAVLNPLLSSQIISPLLSNQINSLLRSDIGSLDIDFNLNTYNNVDLGVALRLYNDRIILSREGQITGSQSNIGDIGATYRINNTLSVTAFHRQDPTFSNLSGGEESQQAQDINGVGFEAEVSFNSWQEFFRRISSPFRKLFGKKEDNTEIATSE